LSDILNEGNKKAKTVAAKTISEAKSVMGL
jgi:hypothetical protein